MWAESFSDFSVTQFQRQLKISEHCAQEKKEWEHKEKNLHSKALSSTESSQASWPKAEISPEVMEEEVNQSMVPSSMTKTSHFFIQSPIFFPWLTQVKIPMDHNFSLHLKKLSG